jgi:hypothetical protein
MVYPGSGSADEPDTLADSLEILVVYRVIPYGQYFFEYLLFLVFSIIPFAAYFPTPTFTLTLSPALRLPDYRLLTRRSERFSIAKEKVRDRDKHGSGEGKNQK